MFTIGEVVSYGATGLCTIEDIRQESLSRGGTKKQEYYILRPVAAPTCTTYVPVANEALTAKLRRIYTKEQIDALIVSVKDQKLEWIEDIRMRADVFGKVISRGISAELLKLIACLYLEKRSCAGSKRKFSTTDEQMLAAAERIVSEEFGYALQIPPKQVASYIAGHVGAIMEE